MIRTAADHLADIARQAEVERSRRRYADSHPSQADRMAYGAALRDDVMSHWRNSGMSLQQLHEKSGINLHTLHRWANRETTYPQIATAQAILRALGKTLAVAALH